MKGVVFLGDRKLELRDFPDPTPGARDVVREIKASGMCGSDLHNYRAPANPGGAVTGGIKRAAGVIAGHEPCGVVAAVGTAVTDKEARIGQRVMDHHYDGCGNCKHCRAGWTQMCLEGTVVYGSGGHGGHAKYMKVPVSTLVPLPDSLSFVTGAAISCGTGTAWGALRRVQLHGGETIAIFGQGPVGLSATQLAVEMGARYLVAGTGRPAVRSPYGRRRRRTGCRPLEPEEKCWRDFTRSRCIRCTDPAVASSIFMTER